MTVSIINRQNQVTYTTTYINFSTIKKIGNVRKRHSTKLWSNVITQWAMTNHTLFRLYYTTGTQSIFPGLLYSSIYPHAYTDRQSSTNSSAVDQSSHFDPLASSSCTCSLLSRTYTCTSKPMCITIVSSGTRRPRSCRSWVYCFTLGPRQPWPQCSAPAVSRDLEHGLYNYLISRPLNYK